MIPIANIPAEINTSMPDESERSCKPINEKIEESSNIPEVEIFLDTSPANALPIIIIPFMNARTNKAFTPVSLNKDSILWVVPNSVVAERSMQNAMNRYKGVAIFLVYVSGLSLILIIQSRENLDHKIESHNKVEG